MLVCVVLTPFRLSQISFFTPQRPQMPSSVPTDCPDVGIAPLLLLPYSKYRSVPLTLLLFPFFTSSFQAVEWIHIFLSSGQGILPLFSWYSVRNAASIKVFVRHPWWEMDSMFTYSSAILSTPIYLCLRKKFQFLLTLVTPHMFTFCFLKKKFHIFRPFQFHNTILSFIVTKLYIRSSDLINFILENV